MTLPFFSIYVDEQKSITGSNDSTSLDSRSYIALPIIARPRRRIARLAHPSSSQHNSKHHQQPRECKHERNNEWQQRYLVWQPPRSELRRIFSNRESRVPCTTTTWRSITLIADATGWVCGTDSTNSRALCCTGGGDSFHLIKRLVSLCVFTI